MKEIYISNICRSKKSRKGSKEKQVNLSSKSLRKEPKPGKAFTAKKSLGLDLAAGW